jgi:hypothetical protein
MAKLTEMNRQMFNVFFNATRESGNPFLSDESNFHRVGPHQELTVNISKNITFCQ